MTSKQRMLAGLIDMLVEKIAFTHYSMVNDDPLVNGKRVFCRKTRIMIWKDIILIFNKAPVNNRLFLWLVLANQPINSY